MVTRILEYIQQPLPLGLRVVSQSIPVMFFGNIETATYATFGINPSKMEFLDKNGNLLSANEKRFVDRSVLGVSDQEILTIEYSKRVYKSLVEYYDKNNNPYKKWFNVLDTVFRDLKKSYYNGSLVHLDIFPWATNPTWNSLSKHEKTKMIENGKKCLEMILEESKISHIYINGRSAMNHFEENVCEMHSFDWINHRKISCELKKGNYNGLKIIGWSTNLQSSYGVSTDFIGILRDRIAGI